jgi:ubiquinone/menaquinone biosynthesis C-methylase UbiE
MRRLQLFEFHDEPWYPEPLRALVREVLDRADRTTGFAGALAEPFAEALRDSGARQVLDLCSGAGGPVVLVAQAMADRGLAPPQVVLSDLYPHVEAWQRLRDRHPGWLDFVESPVDATRLPADTFARGRAELVTVINALHHLPEPAVAAMLAEVTRRGASIFVAEGFPRSLARATAYLPALVAAVPAALSRTRSQRLLKLWLAVTVLPVTGGWDWFASALRVHEPAELIEVARTIAPGYRWRHGAAPFPPWGRAVYLVGLAPTSWADSTHRSTRW